MSRPSKYFLDTNVLIKAFRDAEANSGLQRFHLFFAPSEYLSSVVIQELVAGARTAKARRALERNVIAVFRDRQRIVAPSAAAWERSGEVLAELARADGTDLRRVPKSFGNDILLALSCRETGATLITDNAEDFKRISKITRFKFITTFPGPIPR